MKRLSDVCIVMLAGLVLWPLILIIALLVRMKIGAPIVFRQTRPGRNERAFSLYKFRTMTDERNAEGKLLPDSERMTSFGAFLRSSSLDELPSLFNILKGDMSVVGPRPLLPEYLPLYSDEQRLRHAVRPGLTGWAQVNGRNSISWERRFELDTWYVENRTICLDLKIILMTIRKVFRREGISAEGEATMTAFTGNNSSD